LRFAEWVAESSVLAQDRLRFRAVVVVVVVVIGVVLIIRRTRRMSPGTLTSGVVVIENSTISRIYGSTPAFW
jgi:hypothetical protein